ncbi:hypothetical protein C8R45DRAFT_1171729 [Mycena sanguinolenta]|nr:hypothetical protein C8R45DRAFT_1171729 [Mycena sanguinolenta]
MGKTSLARATLHHQDTLARFEQRFFVSAESATTSVELAALIGLHIGLNPSRDITTAIVHYFSRKPSSLLILDNLEAVWEPTQSRAGVEELLSLLADVEYLGLIITMRGAERPARVQWTRPFLLPLQPLSNHAAMQTFMDITDDSYSAQDFNQLLGFTDNLPLAVDLLAHLVDSEGLENVLARWETEKTTMLSVGYDRKSNLDASINLSLSSPRITSGSKELLSLLSILPNGLSDAELVQSKLPISNILSCKAALLATALAYVNSNKRLLVLIPVREHLQQSSLPLPPLVYCLQKYFHALLSLFKMYMHKGVQWQPVITQMTLNLGNLEAVLEQGLDVDHPELTDIFIIEVLGSKLDSHPTLSREQLISEGISHFKHVNDYLLESKFYSVASFHADRESDFQHTLQFISKAQQLAQLSGDITQQYLVLLFMARLKVVGGEYATAQKYANEAQQLSELSADLYHSAGALFIQAQCSQYLGNYRKSIVQLDQAKEILEVCGMPGGLLGYEVRLYQAELHLLKSEYMQARSMFRDIAESTSKTQQLVQYTTASVCVAYIDIQIGAATADIWKHLAIIRDIYRKGSGLRVLEACLHLRENTFELARVAFQECLHSSRAATQSLCLEHLADIKAWPTTIEQTSWPVIYLGFAYKAKEKLALYKALLFLGDVFIASKDENTALSLYTVTLEGFRYMGMHQKQAECMLRLGDLAQTHGNTAAAIIHWKRAHPLFERSSQSKQVAQIDSKLDATGWAYGKTLVTLANMEAPNQQLHMFPSSNYESPNAVLV